MPTDVQIVNMALGLIGHGPITSLSDTDRASAACALYWPNCRDEVLRAHPWNKATKRARLSTTTVALDTAPAITQANPGVFTTGSAHGLSPNDRVVIAAVEGMTAVNGTWYVNTTPSGTTFTLKDGDDTVLDTSDTDLYPAHSGGGTVELIPAFDYDHFYAKPADCLRVLEVEGTDEDWITQQGNILCNFGSPITVRYIERVATDAWDDEDPMLNMALALRLAVPLATFLANSATDAERLEGRWERFMSRARAVDAMEQTPPDFEEDAWVMARYTY